MAEAKAKATNASPKSKGEAAVAEAKNEPQTVDFHGLTLEIPSTLPGTVLFDLAEIESGRDFKGSMEILKSILGEEGYAAVRAKIAEEGIGFLEAVEEVQSLIVTLFEAAGVGLGE